MEKRSGSQAPGLSMADRGTEASNTSHESGFFSTGNLTQGEINQTFPRRRKNASRASLRGSGNQQGGELELAMSSGASACSYPSAISSQKFKLRHLQHVRSQITQKQVFLSLKPLQFEIPRSSSSSQSFIGRQWILRELHSLLSSHLPTNRGVIIKGGPGTGKTALVLHLVENSLRGQRGERNESGSLNTAPPGKYLYSLNLIHFNLRSQIIAMDNSICLVIAKVT